MEHRRAEDGVFASVIKFWPLMAAGAVTIAGWGSTQQKVSDGEKKYEILEERTRRAEDRLARVEQAITELPDIRKDIKEILRRTPR